MLDTRTKSRHSISLRGFDRFAPLLQRYKCMCVYVYIYIYIERERDLYVYTHYIYIYIYIYSVYIIL